MGHAPSKETLSQFKGLILDGVVPVDNELGRGAYGIVFTVRYVNLLIYEMLSYCNNNNI